MKDGVYKVSKGNLIGFLGEIVASGILEKEFPKPEWLIIKSHTYPFRSDSCGSCRSYFYKTITRVENTNELIEMVKNRKTSFPFRSQEENASVDCLEEPDFVIKSITETKLIEVKATLHKKVELGGNEINRLREQMLNYKKLFPNSIMFILKISLSEFPSVNYSFEEFKQNKRVEINHN